MMFTKSSILVAVFAIAQVAVATPPACLLAAVNTYNNPSDVSGACKSDDVLSSLKSACGGDYNTAMSAFSSICKDAGVTVQAPKGSSGSQTTKGSSGSQTTKGSSGPQTTKGSSGSQTTKGSSATATKSGMSTQTGKPSGGSTPTATQKGGSPTGTGSADSAGSAPSDAAGHVQAGAYLAMVAAGFAIVF